MTARQCREMVVPLHDVQSVPPWPGVGPGAGGVFDGEEGLWVPVVLFA